MMAIGHKKYCIRFGSWSILREKKNMIHLRKICIQNSHIKKKIIKFSHHVILVHFANSLSSIASGSHLIKKLA